MAFIAFYLFIKPLSLLPLPALFGLSDGLYFILYYIIRFRRRVVWDNLIRSFPEKDRVVLHHLMRQFYRHLSNLLVESLRMFSMEDKEALRRFVIKNPELLMPYFKEGRSVLMATGHYNNWEWLAMTLNPQVLHTAVGIYNPLRNPFFERKIQGSRGKFGIIMVPKKRSARIFENRKGDPSIYMMPGDQSPTYANQVHWMNFLHQDTAVFIGIEKLAKKYDYPVVFAHVHKIRRGYYECSFELITDSPKDTPYGFITESHTRMLEKNIHAAPEFWLWTHKRWKRKRETDNQTL
jgi:KDO2-lipid IV(A) lauroyltransferase